MAKENLDNQEVLENIIELIDEDGNEFPCEVINILEIAGVEYLIVAPMDTEDDEESVVPLRVEVDEDGNENYFAVDDEEEFLAIVRVWESLENEDDLDLDDVLS